MERTYSQKLALGYAIGGCVLLLPILFAFGVTFLNYLLDGNNPVNQPVNPAYPPIPTPINDTLFMFGVVMVAVVLIIGYFRHSRDRLGPGLTTSLWVGTLISASTILIPMFAISIILYREVRSSLKAVMLVGAIDLVYLILCVAVMTLPIIAIISNRKLKRPTI